MSKRCTRLGHDFKDQRTSGNRIIVTCIECGSRKDFHVDDKQSALKLLRRSIIQPSDKEKWTELHGSSYYKEKEIEDERKRKRGTKEEIKKEMVDMVKSEMEQKLII
jgi:predicted  nucleic acid-binding Zn-ribbon protein